MDRLTRRAFVRGLISTCAASYTMLLPRVGRALVDLPDGAPPFRVLVNIEFLGGCDQHSIWVPTDSARFNALKARRPTSMIVSSPSDTLPLGSIGLNPRLAGVHRHRDHLKLYIQTSNSLNEGQTGSHEDAQNLMSLGTHKSGGRFEGWKARLFMNEPNATLLGFRGTRPSNLNCDRGRAKCSEEPPLVVDTFESFRLDGVNLRSQFGGANNSAHIAQVVRDMARVRPNSRAVPLLEDRYRDLQMGLGPALDNVSDLLSYVTPHAADYPNDTFAVRLRNVASYIKRMKAQGSSERAIISIGLGGFDWHSSWTASMHSLLQNIGESIGVFWDDMLAMGVHNNVVLMTSTEFGRRIPHNGAGTDHGTASSTIVLGGRVKGGANAVYGEVMSASDFATRHVPPAEVDNRSLIATVLNDFMGLDYQSAFPGEIAREFSLETHDLFLS